MSSRQEELSTLTIANRELWDTTRWLFLTAGLFFLLNIGLGFLNALTTGSLPSWQLLTHLHAGALGWLTLGGFGFAIWLFAGQRALSDAYVRNVRWLASLAIVAIGAYVLSFPIAFTQAGSLWLLLPIFGGAAMLTIWGMAAYVMYDVRAQEPISTIHLFLGATFLVASLGALMGVLIGLHHAIGVGIADVMAHAPVMFFYLLLLSSAIVDWVVLDGADHDWTWLAVIQAVLLVLAALLPPALVFGVPEAIAPLLLLCLLAFLVVFVVRAGWRAMWTNPLETGPRAWTFFGSLWLIIAVLSFPLELVIQPPPDWLLPVLAHIVFLGIGTNLILAVLTVRTDPTVDPVGWAEGAALWVLNIGIVIFVALRITMETRDGAYIMGSGAVIAVLVILYRLVTGASES